jgi:hypothetical protein
MPLAAVFCMALAAPPAPVRAGMVYRIEDGERSGTVWTAGTDARMEYDPVEGSAPRRPTVIWKDGGKKVLVVNDTDGTYYDQKIYGANWGKAASVDVMTVRSPFEVAGARKVKVAVVPSAQAASAETCRAVAMSFSYELKLRIPQAPGTFPGEVEGVADLCVAETFAVAPMPFEHGSLPVTGIQEVDQVFAERLAAVKGTVVRRKITATRRIENGTPVTNTSSVELKDARPTEIAADRFDVPAGYRYQEPVIVAPQRQ